jgi:hypothetical protein
MKSSKQRLNISFDKSLILKYRLTHDIVKKEHESRHFNDLLTCLAKERSYTFNSIIFRHNDDKNHKVDKIQKVVNRQVSKEMKPLTFYEKKPIKPNQSMNNLKTKMPPIRSRNQEGINEVPKHNQRTMSVSLNVNVNLNYTQNGNTFNINNYTRRAPLNNVSLNETKNKNFKVCIPVTNKSTFDKKNIIRLYKNKLHKL